MWNASPIPHPTIDHRCMALRYRPVASAQADPRQQQHDRPVASRPACPEQCEDFLIAGTFDRRLGFLELVTGAEAMGSVRRPSSGRPRQVSAVSQVVEHSEQPLRRLVVRHRETRFPRLAVRARLTRFAPRAGVLPGPGTTVLPAACVYCSHLMNRPMFMAAVLQARPVLAHQCRKGAHRPRKDFTVESARSRPNRNSRRYRSATSTTAASPRLHRPPHTLRPRHRHPLGTGLHRRPLDPPSAPLGPRHPRHRRLHRPRPQTHLTDQPRGQLR